MPKNWPQLFSCKFLTAGLVSYEDSGAGIALLKKETIDNMLPSFLGKPVIVDHQDVTPENFKNVAKGYVTRAWFCPEDGWFYADFLVDDDDAIKCIEEDGYSVSCAYNVLDAVEGSTYQDIEYDGEITEGSFTHLALVKSPRYEESKIIKDVPMMLVNSKQAHYVTNNKEEKSMDILKIFKKNAKGEKQEYTGMVVNIDGQEMPVDHLVKNYMDATAAEAEELKLKEKEKEGSKKNDKLMNSTDIVDVNGNKVSIGEMVDKVNVYKNKNSKKENASDDEAARKEELKKEEGKMDKANEKGAEGDEENLKKANEKDDEQAKDVKKEEKKSGEKDVAEAKKDNDKEEEKKDDDKKENSKKSGGEFFVELQNASNQVATEEGQRVLPMTRSERAAAWKARNAKQQ